MYRQGDVYIRPLPETLELGEPLPAEPRGVVLAYGEVTGHAHVLDPEACELYPLPEHLRTDMTSVSNGRVLRVLKPVSLRHEEHDPIDLEPGDYYIGIQIEYDEKEWRRVVD